MIDWNKELHNSLIKIGSTVLFGSGSYIIMHFTRNFIAQYRKKRNDKIIK